MRSSPVAPSAAVSTWWPARPRILTPKDTDMPSYSGLTDQRIEDLVDSLASLQ
jgi:hypothetical protein